MSKPDDAMPLGLAALLVFPGVRITPQTVFRPQGGGWARLWRLKMDDVSRAAIAEAMFCNPVDVEDEISKRLIRGNPLFKHKVSENERKI